MTQQLPLPRRNIIVSHLLPPGDKNSRLRLNGQVHHVDLLISGLLAPAAHASSPMNSLACCLLDAFVH